MKSLGSIDTLNSLSWANLQIYGKGEKKMAERFFHVEGQEWRELRGFLPTESEWLFEAVLETLPWSCRIIKRWRTNWYLKFYCQISALARNCRLISFPFQPQHLVVWWRPWTGEMAAVSVFISIKYSIHVFIDFVAALL